MCMYVVYIDTVLHSALILVHVYELVVHRCLMPGNREGCIYKVIHIPR